LQINRVMDILGVVPGKNVADIGSGSGWFTVRAARRVAETGKVYAVDINPEAIRYIDERAKKEQLHDVVTILGKEDDPLLPAGQIDVVLLLKTYHEVAKPIALLRNLRAALRPGAKVGIIDRNGNGENHGVQRSTVLQEAAEAGYELAGSYDFRSEEDDPLLPAGQIDVVLLLKTYHEVAKPIALLRNLRAALRPGAKVGIIDRNGNGENHGVQRSTVLQEAAEAGYELAGSYDF